MHSWVCKRRERRAVENDSSIQAFSFAREPNASIGVDGDDMFLAYSTWHRGIILYPNLLPTPVVSVVIEEAHPAVPRGAMPLLGQRT